jgi:hypothetical protein
MAVFATVARHCDQRVNELGGEGDFSLPGVAFSIMLPISEGSSLGYVFYISKAIHS